MERIILHSDFNSFFASVECYLRPEIATKPVAVVGDPDKRHGIVLAKNNVAKQYGIATAETIWSAQRKCPDLVLVPPHYNEYLEFSHRAFLLYSRYTPLVEPFGLDECWLDISAPNLDFKGAEEFAQLLRKTVKNEIGITVSIGVSFTKTFAKLASDLKKPDAVSVISRSNYKDVAWKLPCESLLFVGNATKRRLNSHGMFTIGDIARTPKDILTRFLGKQGEVLYSYANGLDNSPVAAATDSTSAKSIGNSTTTPCDLKTYDEVNSVIYALCDKVSCRLRESGVRCTTLQISIKDSNFITVDRQTKLEIPTSVTNELAEVAIALFKKHYDPTKRPVRLIGVNASGLITNDAPYQMTLFDDAQKRKKQTAVDAATDNLRKRFGFSIVSRASAIEKMPKDTHSFLKHHKTDDDAT